jgi:peptidoglycan/LPS O-acetylase OafA/YrhL
MESSMRAYCELGLLGFLCFCLLLLRPFSDQITQSVLWKPAAALGTISYSLYLVQQFNLTLVATLTRVLLPVPPSLIIQTTTQVLLHIGIAFAFWYLCERPFLSLRLVSPTAQRMPLAQTPVFKGDL